MQASTAGTSPGTAAGDQHGLLRTPTVAGVVRRPYRRRTTAAGEGRAPAEVVPRLRREFTRYADPVPALLDVIDTTVLGTYPHIVNTLHEQWGHAALGNARLAGAANGPIPRHPVPPSQVSDMHTVAATCLIASSPHSSPAARRRAQSKGQQIAALSALDRRHQAATPVTENTSDERHTPATVAASGARRFHR